MPDQPKPKDAGALWRDQPEEKLAVKLEQFADRRTQELYASTRYEVLMSIVAAVFFLAMIAWRFAGERRPVPPVAFAAVVAWVLISLYWFRDRIWRKAPAKDALAATGLDHYRKELERRRDHLRNAWLWHGPLLLACAIFVTTVLGRAFSERLPGMLPLFAVLAAWIAFGIWRRLREAREIQREIDDLMRA